MKKANPNTLSDTFEGVTINTVNNTRFCLSLSSTTAEEQRAWKEEVWQSLPNGKPSSPKVLLNMFSPAHEKTNRLLNCKQFSKTTITAT